MSVLYLALPHLAADLQPSSTQLLWITDIYGFMVAGFLVTMGTLGDRIGRRKLLMTGAVAFAAASVLAAYSTSAEMLIATRTVLGIAGATLMPSTLGLISNMFKDPKQRGVAIAVWMSCFMGGTALGPAIGGVLLEAFWWGSVFLLGVPVMALLLATGPVLLPEHRNPQPGRIDLASVALSLGTILPAIYGLKELAKDGVTTTAVGALIVGAVVGVAFVRRQLRLADPLVDLRLFRNRRFSSALGLFSVGGFAMGGIFLFVSQYLQLVEGLSPLQAGLWLVPPSVAMIGGTMFGPALSQRLGTGWVIGGGMGLAAVGLALMTQVAATGGLGLIVAGLMVATVGLGPGAALGVDIVVGSAPPERASSAASVAETSGEFGIALGIATLGSLGTAIYRSDLTVPEGTPAELATAAQDSLSGAAVAAAHLPGDVAGPLIEAAREAFMTGLNTVAGIGAAAMFVFAVVGVTLFRRFQPPAPAPETPDVTDAEPEPVAA
ncbi:MFS transporter [Jiangella aurantiaca]|uniref:MFS transporter n=2 Tax=Jiangella aurantiaca TaxID=2530373 RepID=A0A4R5A2U9_9ACTN|nr:MFS transporter [Jiangella aurantiaca]